MARLAPPTSPFSSSSSSLFLERPSFCCPPGAVPVVHTLLSEFPCCLPSSLHSPPLPLGLAPSTGARAQQNPARANEETETKVNHASPLRPGSGGYAAGDSAIRLAFRFRQDSRIFFLRPCPPPRLADNLQHRPAHRSAPRPIFNHSHRPQLRIVVPINWRLGNPS